MVRDGHLQEKHFDRGQGDRFDRGAAHQLAGFAVYYFYAKDHLQEWFR
ncbi:MAG: hypothetical protein ACLUQ6_04000 [Alistipes onderdonkii]